MPPTTLAIHWAKTIDGIAAPNAIKGKMSESTAAPTTFEPLTRTAQERPANNW